MLFGFLDFTAQPQPIIPAPPNGARRAGCACGCGDDEDFWRDDYGGRFHNIWGPISLARFTQQRNCAPCHAYGLYRQYARFTDDEGSDGEESDGEESDGEEAPAPPVVPPAVPAAAGVWVFMCLTTLRAKILPAKTRSQRLWT